MDHSSHRQSASSPNYLAFTATVHCLTGCSIGEVLGMVIGRALGMGVWPTVALAVILAFIFGYLMTLIPLLRSDMAFKTALSLALAADTVSITVMEIVDNAVMLFIPGAMDAGLSDFLFWGSLLISLILAGFAAYPVNRWLISRGRGHAVVHKGHKGHGPDSGPAE